MIFLDLPTINGGGTAEQQLAEIRSYIYRNNEQINAALSNLTIDRIWENTANSLTAAVNGNSDESSELLTQYQRIRDLIIKTADIIVQTDEKWDMSLNGSYLAKSQFGEYLLDTSVEIDGKSTGFTQVYNYSAAANEFAQYSKNFIKEGLLDNSGTEPIYGIEVGLLKTEFTITDEEGNTKVITCNSNKSLRITPTELSFIDDGYKVAYINSKAIYFPNANITGGSFNIGNGTFTVDSNGNLTAKKGTIEANMFRTSFNGVSSYLQLYSKYLRTYDSTNTLASEYGDYGLSFYNDDGVTTASIYKMNAGNTSGIGTLLNYHTGGFNIINAHFTDSSHYVYDVVWSAGADGQYISQNIYEQQGLHITTPCWFHNSKLHNIDISSCESDGYSTITGQINIKCQNSSGNEFYSTLIVRNGLITGLYTEKIGG